jgi:Ca-activated chloride channel family protein
VSFAQPQLLTWLALPLALLLLAAWAVGRARSRRRAFFGAQATRLAPGFSRGRRLLRDGLAAGALALVVVALARPERGEWLREVRQRGVDVMVVLDTSRSMLATDVPPTRLARAQREIQALLGHLRGDRVGLVTFAGDARLLCPLTSDPTSFRIFLDDVDTTTNGLGGTAVGEGLERALDALADGAEGARVIVLLTDGEDHASDPAPTEVAYRALAMGVPVHVITFGTPEGSEIPVLRDDGAVDVVRGPDGQPVISRPDEELLERVAGIAGGACLSAARTAFPMDELWDKRIGVMEGVTRASSQRKEGVNRFQWALVLALAALGVRALLPERVAP